MSEDFEELKFHVNEKFQDSLKTTTTELLQYCRYLQKEFVEGDGEVSGVEALASMLQRGTITLKMFVDILPAVQYYKTDYVLRIDIDTAPIDKVIDDQHKINKKMVDAIVENQKVLRSETKKREA